MSDMDDMDEGSGIVKKFMFLTQVALHGRAGRSGGGADYCRFPSGCEDGFLLMMVLHQLEGH